MFPNLSVEDNLLIGGSLKRARGRRDANLRRVYECFPRLDERRRQSAGTLSGGEQQMVAIGRAMMSEPEMIMFDEPSIGLSPVLTGVMFDVIKKLHGDKITIFLVEQNVASSFLSAIEAMSSRMEASCSKDRATPAFQRGCQARLSGALERVPTGRMPGSPRQTRSVCAGRARQRDRRDVRGISEALH